MNLKGTCSGSSIPKEAENRIKMVTYDEEYEND